MKLLDLKYVINKNITLTKKLVNKTFNMNN